MATKPTKPAATESAAKKRRSKGSAKRRTRGGGDGSGTKRSRDTDSGADKNSATGQESTPEHEPMSLETMIALLGSNIQFWKRPDGTTQTFDSLLLEAKLNPKVGKPAIERLCRIALKLQHSIEFWANAKHMPEIASLAQITLADTLLSLRGSGFINKLASPATRFGSAFAQRWSQGVNSKAKRSKYAAISLFMMELQAKERTVLSELVENSAKPLAEDSPVYVRAVLPTVRYIMEKAIPPGTDVLVETVISMIKRLMRLSVDDELWQEFYEPLAAEIWPAFAREHEQFKGWKVLRGLPLSARKRSVDEKTDFGFKRLSGTIKAHVIEHLAFERHYHGDGHVILPDGKVLLGLKGAK